MMLCGGIYLGIIMVRCQGKKMIRLTARSWRFPDTTSSNRYPNHFLARRAGLVEP